MRSNTAQKVSNYVRNNKGKLAVDVIAGTAVAYLAHTKAHLGFTGTMATFAAAGVATHIVVHKIGVQNSMRGLGIGSVVAGRHAVRFSRTAFARNILPVAAGLGATYLAYKDGYIPHSPAGYIGAIIPFVLTAGATRWALKTLVHPTIGGVAKGMLVAAAVTIAAPAITNWAVDEGFLPTNNPTVMFVHNASHNLGLDRFTLNAQIPVGAPLILQNGVIADGPAVANNTEALYTSTSLDKSGQAPAVLIPPGTPECVTYPGDGLLQIKTGDGKTLYAQNSADWLPAPASKVCNGILNPKIAP
jgi:hypothetical protein